MPLEQTCRQWTALAAGLALLPLLLALPDPSRLLILACYTIGAASLLLQRPLPGWLRLLLTGLAVLVVLWQFNISLGTRNFGRDAGSVLLASMLGLKLLETKSLRDGRGVVGFALFALMAAFLQDQGPLILGLGGVATLALLAALAAYAEVETPSGRSADFAVQLRQRSRQVATLLLFSLPLALAGFLFFPRLASPLWGLPENSSEARTGLSDDMSPGDIANLSTDDTPVLRVSFEGPRPDASQLYFRGPVLIDFDGRRWTRWRWGMPGFPPLLPGGRSIAYTIEQEATDRHYLLALDLPQAAPADAFMSRERSILLRQKQGRLVRHRIESQLGVGFEVPLQAPMRNATLTLPGGFNPRSLDLARQWRAAAGADDEAVIMRALELFRDEFTYTLEPGLLGRDSVDDFLFETRRGYCEHFSSAFVVLMRAAGIPARVVTGYQGGVVNPIGDYLLVRQSDAHAWAEVWLDGRGWQRVDPTNAVSPERIERGLDSLRSPSPWSELWRPLWQTADWMRRGWNDYVLGFNAARQRQLLQPFGFNDPDWRQLVAALGIAALLALAATLYLLLRPGPDGRDPVQRAFAQFRRRLARAGLAQPIWQTPQALAAAAGQRWPSQAEAISELCQRYDGWLYAAPSPDPQTAADLVRQLRQFRLSR